MAESVRRTGLDDEGPRKRNRSLGSSNPDGLEACERGADRVSDRLGYRVAPFSERFQDAGLRNASWPAPSSWPAYRVLGVHAERPGSPDPPQSNHSSEAGADHSGSRRFSGWDESSHADDNSGEAPETNSQEAEAAFAAARANCQCTYCRSIRAHDAACDQEETAFDVLDGRIPWPMVWLLFGGMVGLIIVGWFYS